MRKLYIKILMVFILLFFSTIELTKACSCFIVSKGASTDGSTFMTYTFDMHTHAGELYYTPESTHAAGVMKKMYEWDTGKYLGEIPQIPHTYSVVGNMNQYQVAMNETTYGGRGLNDTNGKLDYGGLIFTTLQRAKTAREAIRVMDQLVRDYGYYSSGETYTVLDENEVWIVDFIGKGSDEKGSVWVARRVPEGYVSGHANQSRITTFPLSNGRTSITSKQWKKLNNPELECIYAHDVIDFARKKKFYEGADKDFNFADAYDPIDFRGMRFAEARVWSMFNRVKKGMDKYIPYATGENPNLRMPLWIKPDAKLSIKDVISVMRDHYKGTLLDMSDKIGAEPFGNPMRYRPMMWSLEDEEVLEGEEKTKYLFERSISTQQTAFSSIAQGRSWLPDPIGGVLWFGIDDTYQTVYTPMYCAIKEIPVSYAESKNRIITYDRDHVHWVFNLVANLTYSRFNLLIPDVQNVQSELEDKYIGVQTAVEKEVLELYEVDPNQAIDYLTNYSVSQGENTVKRWQELGEFLLVRYMDGNMKKVKDGKFELNEYGNVAYPEFPGYSQEYYKAVVKQRGEDIKLRELEKE